MLVTSQRSPDSRFQRALKTGNLNVIRNAAAELPTVDLGDALAVCVAIRDAEPHHLERAAFRWLARFLLERRDATLADVSEAATAFTQMAERPAEALETLRKICNQPDQATKPNQAPSSQTKASADYLAGCWSSRAQAHARARLRWTQWSAPTWITLTTTDSPSALRQSTSTSVGPSVVNAPAIGTAVLTSSATSTL